MRHKSLILLVFYSTVSSAALPDFSFKSPSFNGQGYGSYQVTLENEAYTRAQEIKQALEAAAQAAKNAAANTPINQFLTNLESRIYAQIGQNLATAMFAGGDKTAGSIDFEGNTIFWQNNGSNISLQVTDSLGNVTTITVPLGSFNITGTGG
jgi:hypothetical protein